MQTPALDKTREVVARRNIYLSSAEHLGSDMKTVTRFESSEFAVLLKWAHKICKTPRQVAFGSMEQNMWYVVLVG